MAKISLTCTLGRNTSRHTPGLDWPLNKDNNQQNLCIRRSRSINVNREFPLTPAVSQGFSESLRRTISLQGSFSAISWTRMCRVPQNGVIENLSFFVEHWESNQIKWDPSQGQKWSRREMVRIRDWPRSCTLQFTIQYYCICAYILIWYRVDTLANLLQTNNSWHITTVECKCWAEYTYIVYYITV